MEESRKMPILLCDWMRLLNTEDIRIGSACP